MERYRRDRCRWRGHRHLVKPVWRWRLLSGAI